MKKYLIKATITGGPHEGKTYYLRKGGYVITRPDGVLCAEDYYTEASAKMVATKSNKRQDYYKWVGATTVEPTKYEAVEVA